MEHSVQDLYEMHVIVKGQVQGVGFRAATRRYAHHLALKGTVRNLEDGSVEIYAQGPKRYLEELVKSLKNEIGDVQEATIEYFPIMHSHDDFRIIY
jgi:acylphosphatase